MLVKFSTGWALYAFPLITIVLVAAILCGAWVAAAWRVLDLASAFAFWWLLSRPDWPREGR